VTDLARGELAIDGGDPAVVDPLPAMFPGGLRIGDTGERAVDYSFVATLAAVLATGAVPILAEVDQTLTISAADTADKITERTRAVVPVHVRGASSDLGALVRLAEAHDLAPVGDVGRRQAPVAGVGDWARSVMPPPSAFSTRRSSLRVKAVSSSPPTTPATRGPRMYHDPNSALRHNSRPTRSRSAATCTSPNCKRVLSALV
jgi:hypothetical protein